MNPESKKSASDQTPSNPPPDFQAYVDSLPPMQQWTTDGFPIVDNKYLNLNTGEVETHTGRSVGGPPNITVYWQNRTCTGRGDQFLVTTRTIYSTRSLGEYIIRIGDLLRKGPGVCKLDSLNATPYSVYLVVSSELSGAEFSQALQEHGLT
ncbi:hypothetical protein QBC39DRAFT_382745 [Podospora conica]|nr:hypothetical protein QBC39DRAFT_382745 [Schizothecium conicum]